MGKVFKTKQDCKTILETTRGRPSRGTGSYADKACALLNDFKATGDWKTQVITNCLASFYLDDRPGSDRPVVFGGLGQIIKAMDINWAKFSPEVQRDFCMLTAAPELLSGASNSDIASFIYVGGNDENDYKTIRPGGVLVKALYTAELRWNSIGKSASYMLFDGLTTGWFEYHKDFWEPGYSQNFVSAASILQKSAVRKQNFMSRVLGGLVNPYERNSDVDLTMYGSRIVKQLAEDLGTSVSAVEQRRIARSILNGGEIVKPWEYDIPQDVRGALGALRSGDGATLLEVLRARDCNKEVTGLDIAQHFCRVVEKIVSRNSVQDIIAAFKSVGANWRSIGSVSHCNAPVGDYIGRVYMAPHRSNGSTPHRIWPTMFQTPSPFFGEEAFVLSAVTDEAILKEITEDVLSVYMIPALDAMEAYLNKSRPIIELVPFFMDELASGSGTRRVLRDEVVREFLENGRDKSGNFWYHLGLMIKAADELVSKYGASYATYKNDADSVDTVPVRFDD